MPPPPPVLMADAVLDSALLFSGLNHVSQEFNTCIDILRMNKGHEVMPFHFADRMSQERGPVRRHVGEHPVRGKGVYYIIGVFNKGPVPLLAFLQYRFTVFVFPRVDKELRKNVQEFLFSMGVVMALPNGIESDKTQTGAPVHEGYCQEAFDFL